MKTTLDVYTDVKCRPNGALAPRTALYVGPTLGPRDEPQADTFACETEATESHVGSLTVAAVANGIAYYSRKETDATFTLWLADKGSNPPVQLFDDSPGPVGGTSLAASLDRLFVLSGQVVRYYPLPWVGMPAATRVQGSSVTPLAVADTAGFGTVTSLAVDASCIYFTVTPTGTTYQLRRAPKPGATVKDGGIAKPDGASL